MENLVGITPGHPKSESSRRVREAGVRAGGGLPLHAEMPMILYHVYFPETGGEAMTSRDMDKTVDPRAIEGRWYAFWTERGYFRAPDRPSGAVFSMVIPPPNITGVLHMGHAFNNTLQDILARWRRMSGDATLWVPGTDHAGIATQNVVERQLAAEGKSRTAFDRETFIRRVWEWRDHSGRSILSQLKRLGSSCDWSRERFTLDEGLSRAVREVFVRLVEEGLIYRGERLINWCPRCLTALSDIEVEHEEIAGTLYHVEYPLADSPEMRLTVATTRPETMLGDTAVAVHPEDSRFGGLIGRKVRLPLTGRVIPIVGDAILVDREFGTGAVKITPAHDFNDEQAGIRHGLDTLVVFTRDGTMDDAGMAAARVDDDVRREISGKPAAEARAIVVRRLKESGFLVKEIEHRHAVGTCYRCKTVVEPYRSPQWFVKVGPLAAPAIDAVERGKIRFHPKSWENSYFDWMRNIKDWCISRQIWWGHQIPAWYCAACCGDQRIDGAEGTIFSVDAKPIVSRTPPERCPVCGSTELIQDPDVLDTWFSSALWPFSTLGWPDRTPDLSAYYPTSVLVTAFDILFFWVARMIMMGLKFMGDVPFRDVYIHALIRDAEGQKMSKSKGNVIDPLTVMDRYGTDAFRFTLAAMASPGRDIKLAEERIEGYRNFITKLWNAARFILMHLPGEMPAPVRSSLLADRWIVSRLDATIRSVDDSLRAYRFDEAAQRLYGFVWHEFCDWYLEWIKPVLYGDDGPQRRATLTTLVGVFEKTLRLLHPFTPFVTEEIWQHLPHEGESIMRAPFPEFQDDAVDREAEARTARMQAIIAELRAIRGELGLPPSQELRAAIRVTGDDDAALLSEEEGTIRTLARLGRLDWGVSASKPPIAAVGIIDRLEIYVPLEGLVDLAEEENRQKKNLARLGKELSQIIGRLSSESFVAKAPPEVVARDEERKADLSKKIARIDRLLKELQKRGS